MVESRINDLKLAARFVRSIQTENHTLNHELEMIAREIDDLVSRLSAPPSEDLSKSPFGKLRFMDRLL
jgi:hypothetical protein